MKKLYLTIFFLIGLSALIAQEDLNYQMEIFPQGLHFLPFKANYQEARVGILYYTSNADMKVDLGNNVDLIRFTFPESNSILSLSVEFMGYALSTSYSGNRLQIDALDGFFGGNFAYSKMYEKGKFISRFRIIHNSAHLVDGHYDRYQRRWINNDTPIPFTKDFGEISLGYQFYPSFGALRTYGTIAYATMVRPLELEKWSGYFGYELAFNNLLDKTFGAETNLFLASQFNLVGSPKYQLNSKFMGGVKFGNWDEKGLVFYLSYYIGANPFSEYYSQRVNQFGIGFFVDFF